MSNRFKIHLRRVDQDELTAYEWGVINEDGTVSITNDSNDSFDPQNYFAALVPDQYKDCPIRIESIVFWLKHGRSYGSHAHRTKATIEHPLLDRHLQYPEFDLAAIVDGLDHPKSKCHNIHELTHHDPFTKEQNQHSSDPDDNAYISFALQNDTDAKSGIEKTLIPVFNSLSEHEPDTINIRELLPEWYTFRITQYSQAIGFIRITRETLREVDDWASVDLLDTVTKSYRV